VSLRLSPATFGSDYRVSPVSSVGVRAVRRNERASPYTFVGLVIRLSGLLSVAPHSVLHSPRCVTPSIEMMVVLCQRRSVGGNPRQLNHGPKIDFGEGRQAGSSGGPGAFSSQISRCATPSVTTKACHGARATLRRLQAVVSKLAYRPSQKFLGTHAVVIIAGNTLCALSGCLLGLRTAIT
jgi:hypothetical protein